MRFLRKAATAAFLMGAAMLPAQAQQAPRFETTKVAENVYSFRFVGHRSMFVVTRAGVIVADPINPAAAEAMLGEIRKITDKPIKYVLYSHEHLDHAGGGKVFKDVGAKIVAQANCKAVFTRHPNPNVAMPDTFYQNRYKIVLGGTEVRLNHFGPSHGNCQTILELPKEKIVFVVDLASPRTLPFRDMFDSDIKGWISTLEATEKLGATQMIPGHGPAIVPIAQLAEVREYLQDLMGAVKEAMTKTMNRDEIIKTVKLPKYEKWNMYEPWLGMNVERVITYYANGV
jgi:glyoxylase-like metal-dependent hydrolase (beta-lactamase superfamily II)